jgi:hypothetical protein
MIGKKTDLQARLYASCIIVLLVGLGSAALIYLTAEDVPESNVRYEIIDGVAYPVSPSTSKTYLRDLRRFGGKAAVLFDEFNRWFADLWQGKSLAITIAWISIFVALGIFLYALSLPAHAIKEKGPSEN